MRYQPLHHQPRLHSAPSRAQELGTQYSQFLCLDVDRTKFSGSETCSRHNECHHTWRSQGTDGVQYDSVLHYRVHRCTSTVKCGPKYPPAVHTKLNQQFQLQISDISPNISPNISPKLSKLSVCLSTYIEREKKRRKEAEGRKERRGIRESAWEQVLRSWVPLISS